MEVEPLHAAPAGAEALGGGRRSLNTAAYTE